MHYCQFPPHPLLKNLVECYWIIEGSDTGSHKVIGDGYSEIIFHFGDRYTIARNGGITEQQPLAIVAGQLMRPIHLKPKGKSGVLGIKFGPTGLWKMFGVNMALLTDQTEDLVDVIGDNFKSVPDRLKHAASNQERIAIIENILLQKLRQIKTTPVDYFIEQIKKHAGQIIMHELCKTQAFSSRKLQRLFNEQVGISAKQYSRLVRFNRVYNLLQQPDLSKTDITYLCGYFDQSHFNKEFKFFSGEDPGTWINHKHEFSDFFMSR